MNIQLLVWPPTRLKELVTARLSASDNFFRWLNGVQQVLAGTIGQGIGATAPVVVPLAKLTVGGANGHMTLTNGVVTAYTPPT